MTLSEFIHGTLAVLVLIAMLLYIEHLKRKSARLLEESERKLREIQAAREAAASRPAPIAPPPPRELGRPTPRPASRIRRLPLPPPPPLPPLLDPPFTTFSQPHPPFEAFHQDFSSHMRQLMDQQSLLSEEVLLPIHTAIQNLARTVGLPNAPQVSPAEWAQMVVSTPSGETRTYEVADGQTIHISRIHDSVMVSQETPEGESKPLFPKAMKVPAPKPKEPKLPKTWHERLLDEDPWETNESPPQKKT